VEVHKISNNNLRVNDQIRANEVRLIDNEGEQIGIKSTNDAIRTAEERGLDLVEVAPQANPPVCKIMDYGKYKYEQAKKRQKQKKNQNVMKVKEVQMGVKIQDHDFNVKLKQALRFLNDKNKVKVRIRFRGREMVHKDLGYELMDRLKEKTKEIGKVESEPKMEGHSMLMFLTPISEK
jgi:translation initiation factor IF-3